MVQALSLGSRPVCTTFPQAEKKRRLLITQGLFSVRYKLSGEARGGRESVSAKGGAPLPHLAGRVHLTDVAP